MKWFTVVANCHDGVTEFSYHWYNHGMHGSGPLIGCIYILNKY